MPGGISKLMSFQGSTRKSKKFGKVSNKNKASMKAQLAALFVWTTASTDAFVVPSKAFVRSTGSCLSASIEFDFLLNENGASQASTTPRSRRVVTTGSHQSTQLTSSVASDVSTEEDFNEEYAMSEIDEEAVTTQSAAGNDEFKGDNKLASFQEAQGTNKFTKWLSQADFQEVVWTLLVPSLLAFAGVKWGLGKVSVNLADKAATSLESFANEMIYHDGNFDEMSLCKLDWDGRLTWLGPSKKKRMLTVYLEDYTKRKPVSPQAIR